WVRRSSRAATSSRSTPWRSRTSITTGRDLVGDTKPAIWDINLANRDTKFAKAARRMAVPVPAGAKAGRRHSGPGATSGLLEGEGGGFRAPEPHSGSLEGKVLEKHGPFVS